MVPRTRLPPRSSFGRWGFLTPSRGDRRITTCDIPDRLTSSTIADGHPVSILWLINYVRRVLSPASTKLILDGGLVCGPHRGLLVENVQCTALEPAFKMSCWAAGSVYLYSREVYCDASWRNRKVSPILSSAPRSRLNVYTIASAGPIFVCPVSNGVLRDLSDRSPRRVAQSSDPYNRALTRIPVLGIRVGNWICGSGMY